jgi:anti-sigma B factor antagonist
VLVTGDMIMGRNAREFGATSTVSSRAHRRIVINLAGVSYVDSAGRGEVLAARTAVAMSGGQIRLVNLTHRIDELLVITKLSTVFEISSDEHEALEDFH